MRRRAASARGCCGRATENARAPVPRAARAASAENTIRGCAVQSCGATLRARAAGAPGRAPTRRAPAAAASAAATARRATVAIPTVGPSVLLRALVDGNSARCLVAVVAPQVLLRALQDQALHRPVDDRGRFCLSLRIARQRLVERRHMHDVAATAPQPLAPDEQRHRAGLLRE